MEWEMVSAEILFTSKPIKMLNVVLSRRQMLIDENYEWKIERDLMGIAFGKI